MRKSIRRVVAMTFVILLLCSLFPFSCFAVDPVSAATMANALAQAITAYGASNGVSMMYDVTSTDGIGEAMHDLWGQFKADVNDNDVPTYDSLAVTIWSTVFKKVGNNVGINLSSTTVSYMDKFWNWLLSGPAELQKVDDQYYQLSSSQYGPNASDLVVSSYSITSLNGFPVVTLPVSVTRNGHTWEYRGSSYSFFGHKTSTYGYELFFVNTSSSQEVYLYFDGSYDRTIYLNQTDGGYYYNTGVSLSTSESSLIPLSIPVLENIDGNSNLNGKPSGYLGSSSSPSVSTDTSTLGLRGYVGDATADGRVYFPDTDDPDYGPLPYVGPLNYPWQSAWGDGDTITDAQGQSITGALDNAISEDGTLELEGDEVDNPPAGDQIGGPDSYQVPGLADVFPFCIPFDIYNFLSALAAEPTAPYFEATLAFPEAIGGTQTIEIDFDTPTWNQLAQLLRLLELLAFIVGLALLTRSMFIRG